MGLSITNSPELQNLGLSREIKKTSLYKKTELKNRVNQLSGKIDTIGKIVSNVHQTLGFNENADIGWSTTTIREHLDSVMKLLDEIQGNPNLTDNDLEALITLHKEIGGQAKAIADYADKHHFIHPLENEFSQFQEKNDFYVAQLSVLGQARKQKKTFDKGFDKIKKPHTLLQKLRTFFLGNKRPSPAKIQSLVEEMKKHVKENTEYVRVAELKIVRDSVMSIHQEMVDDLSDMITELKGEGTIGDDQVIQSMLIEFRSFIAKENIGLTVQRFEQLRDGYMLQHPEHDVDIYADDTKMSREKFIFSAKALFPEFNPTADMGTTIHEVFPNLWLGGRAPVDMAIEENHQVGGSHKKMKVGGKEVDAVIGLYPNVEGLKKLQRTSHTHLVVPDELAPNQSYKGLAEDIVGAADAIHERLISGKTVYIHCDEGCSSSPLAVMAYLVKYHKITPDDAFKYVFSKRNAVALNTVQKNIIKNLDLYLKDPEKLDGYFNPIAGKAYSLGSSLVGLVNELNEVVADIEQPLKDIRGALQEARPGDMDSHLVDLFTYGKDKYKGGSPLQIAIGCYGLMAEKNLAEAKELLDIIKVMCSKKQGNLLLGDCPESQDFANDVLGLLEGDLEKEGSPLLKAMGWGREHVELLKGEWRQELERRQN